ncbi:MAG: GNAT family N-acetyltransferase [Candidatus Nanopelagicales bacterium]
MRIRPVEPSDTQAVGDVYLAALAGMTYLPTLYTDEETRDFIKDILLRHNEVWVAEQDGAVLGFVGWGDGSVRHMWVLPKEQGQGVGTALLEHVQSRCPDGLKLSVFQRNEGARRLYERHGFVLTELRDGHDNVENEPDCIYVWRPETAD